MTTTLIDPDGREWLESDYRRLLEQDVDDLRAELAEVQTAFAALMDRVRRLPGGEGIWQRVDAYPGVHLDRDMGAGLDADGWMAEVQTFLEAQR